jgi:hypothetical protein
MERMKVEREEQRKRENRREERKRNVCEGRGDGGRENRIGKRLLIISSSDTNP